MATLCGAIYAHPVTAEAEDLTKLPNIGPVLAGRLADIGVTSAAQLRGLGAVAAVQEIMAVDDPACYNTLYALQGAIEGVRWHDLPVATRERLKLELHA